MYTTREVCRVLKTPASVAWRNSRDYARPFSSSYVFNSRVSDAIKDDHRRLESAYNKILEAQNAEDKDKWRNEFTWELACHSIGEELVVYPAFENFIKDGKKIADNDRLDHKIVKDLLYKFQSLGPENPEFTSTLKELWRNLSQHIKEEEGHDLAKLEESLLEADSERLETEFKRTKKFTPTRSHPDAPDKPPFETVVGLMSAPIDRISDLFRKFP